MRRANVVSGMVLAAVGALVLLLVNPWQIEEGPAGMMSPRLVPNLSMVVVMVLSILLVVQNLRAADRPEDAGSPIPRRELVAFAKIAALFGLAIALYIHVSPLAAGGVLMVGGFLALGERRPLVIVLLTGGLLGAVWLLFYRLLGTAIV